MRCQRLRLQIFVSCPCNPTHKRRASRSCGALTKTFFARTLFEHEHQYPPLPSPSSSAPLPPNQVGWRTKSDVDAVVVTVDHPRHEAVVVGLADLRAVPVDLFVEYSSEE